MKRNKTITFLSVLKKGLLLSSFLIAAFCLYSFKIKNIGDEVLRQLGMNRSAADQKITNSILGGSFDIYGVKNARNILLGNRTAVTKDLLAYAKAHLESPAFKKEYLALKEYHKPKKDMVQTPEEMKEERIAAIKKMIVDSEASLKKADATMRPIFQDLVKEGRKQLAEAEDPNNKQFARYTKNYPQLIKDIETGYQLRLEKWESDYPSNSMLFVKRRLEEFLDATKDIDFNAELATKNGKKIFVNPVYERKDNRWKMAFRAGKEVIEPARAFVQQWLKETN